MYRLELKKPDGRQLTLYSRTPIIGIDSAPSPRKEPVHPNPHLRWHPLRGEWVTYASHRQDRTFLPPPEYNPLRPTTDPANPTELPSGKYDVAVFDNLFPSLALVAHDPPHLAIETKPGTGQCDVVVFTQDSQASLGSLPVDHIALLIEVWADRTRTLAATGKIQYVLPFENRGVEVGVTLHHPHGQLYSYSFVPPVPLRMNQMEREYFEANQRPLLQHLIEEELRQKTRVIYDGPEAIAFLPAWARYPYEVWVAPKRAVAYFHDLTQAQRTDLAVALKTVLLKYDGLWQRPFPYIMAWFQAPTDGAAHPEAHLHAEFYPPYRTREKLKYLAGTEIAAGMFASDALPEDKVRELQAVNVSF
ncbi:MAG TPA: galactose-1-phosphate uridylyltransferase [Steroidobacteraceae bacterium]|nr:galactose-1-phosphate uridylyltransferase [Steroidobacteraceae bacterium]